MTRRLLLKLTVQMLAEAVKKQEYEKKRAERKQRHLQEDLRYAMKKLDEPINVNGTYEEV